LRPGGGGALNPFGVDFVAAGHQWTQALCERDSDGDGVANGVELGDPECKWVPGEMPQFDVGITHPGLDCGSGCVDRGSRRRLTADACAGFEEPAGVQSTSIVNTPFDVPSGTTYTLQAFEWTGVQSAILRFDVVNQNPSVVHHMILYRCPSDQSGRYATASPKLKMECTSVLNAWAVGGSDFCLPKDVAFKVSPAKPYFVLEVHYDNPQGLSVMDQSGFRLQHVPWGNSFTAAGVAFVGSKLPTITIPPGVEKYTAISVSKELTIPAQADVYTFALLEHMHGIGREVFVDMVDSDDDLEGVDPDHTLACNTLYDFDLQETKVLAEPYRLQDGKRFRVTCVYDSTSRTETTHGGDETEDEMCIAAIMYYPFVEGSDVGWLADTHLGETTDAVATRTCGCEVGSGGGDSSDDGSNIIGGGSDSFDDSGDADVVDWSDAEIEAQRRADLLLLHGALMLGAWFLCVPLGIAFPLAWRTSLASPTAWFWLHRICMALGIALCGAAYGIAYHVGEGNGRDHLGEDIKGGSHKRVGFALVLLTVAQAIGGTLRPTKAATGEAPSTARGMWRWAHRIGALTALGMAFAQMDSGVALVKLYHYDSNMKSAEWWGAAAAGLGVAAIAAAVGFLRRGTARPHQLRPEFSSDISSKPAVVATVAYAL